MTKATTKSAMKPVDLTPEEKLVILQDRRKAISREIYQEQLNQACAERSGRAMDADNAREKIKIWEDALAVHDEEVAAAEKASHSHE